MSDDPGDYIRELEQALQECLDLAMKGIYRAVPPPTRDLLFLRLGMIAGTASRVLGKSNLDKNDE